MSKYEIMNGNKHLIVSFGGHALQFGGILPFEFLNYLSSTYATCDLLFFLDKKQCWYHEGIEDLTTSIEETVVYLNQLVQKYEKVLFMGTSAGGYAALLFGSLCQVPGVLCFIPQTILKNPKNADYSDLKSIINAKTTYVVFGNARIENPEDLHHISHCEHIDCFPNVTLRRMESSLKELRDSGAFKDMIDSFF